MNALDPAAVVVGGGLGASAGFAEAIAAALRPAIWCEATRALPVVPTALGEAGGVLGAVVADRQVVGNLIVDRHRIRRGRHRHR